MKQSIIKQVERQIEEGVKRAQAVRERLELEKPKLKDYDYVLNHWLQSASIYEEIKKDLAAGNFESPALMLMIDQAGARAAQKIRFRQNKTANQFALAVISPIEIIDHRERIYRALFPKQSLELIYQEDLEDGKAPKLTGMPTGATQIDVMTTMDLWNSAFYITRNARLEMPLKQYMEQQNLRSESSARQKFDRMAATLTSIKIKLEGKGCGRIVLFPSATIINGIVSITGGPELCAIVSSKTGSMVELDRQYRQFDDRILPYAAIFYRKLALHEVMNSKNRNKNKISTKALMESAPGFPKEKDVREKQQRACKEKIMIPFERNLSAINGLTWKYDREVKSYAEFVKAYVIFELEN
ncbi:MAG: hypothetical protein Q8M92_10995 [Candidatus Subteraquimicrobiales bacterium]|nr:hypothetical protein [Candidatus Subteraquimicrobiales bacterium]